MFCFCSLYAWPKSCFVPLTTNTCFTCKLPPLRALASHIYIYVLSKITNIQAQQRYMSRLSYYLCHSNAWLRADFEHHVAPTVSFNRLHETVYAGVNLCLSLRCWLTSLVAFECRKYFILALRLVDASYISSLLCCSSRSQISNQTWPKAPFSFYHTAFMLSFII